MAITYPGAAYRQLSGKSRTLLTPRIINVHTMVWWLSACEDYFAQAGNPYSHFGTGHDGELRQWQDLTYRAASDLDGNPISISIENADKGPGFPTWSGSDVPRFTPDQAATLVPLIAWLCLRFAIPPVLLTNSLPNQFGPSYHRLGIDPWRVTGGIRYSSAYGKACPGDRRIAQLRDEIIPAVRNLITPEDDMTPDEHNALIEIRERGRDMHFGNYRGEDGRPAGDLTWLDDKLEPLHDKLDAVIARLNAIDGGGGAPIPPSSGRITATLDGTITPI